jgi:ribosomal protein S18 acetylase RimI-like enzyme
MAPLIRRARHDDLPELGRLATLLVEEHHGYDARRFIAPTTRTPQSYATFLGPHLDSDDAFVFVADVDGRVAGYAFVALEGFDYKSLRGPAAVLHDLLVSPEHRGHGIGPLLLEAALAELRTRNAPRVVLSTAEQNRSAQQLFERFGFRRTMVEMTCELNGDHGPTQARG